MPALWNHYCFDGPRHGFLNQLKLPGSTELVVSTLQYERRNLNMRDEIEDAPARRICGNEPRVDEPVKRAINVRTMVALESCSEVSVLILLGQVPDRAHSKLFDDNVRRFDDHCAHRRARAPPGVNQRDRGAVAVAKQDCVPDFKLFQNFGKHGERLLVHVGDGTRPRYARGSTVTSPREADGAKAGGLRELLGKVFPEIDAADPFVEEDERRALRVGRPKTLAFEHRAIIQLAKELLHGRLWNALDDVAKDRLLHFAE